MTEGPRPRGSELQWDDRPVFGPLSVKVLVKAQLHGCLHSQDLGGAFPIQALHLGLAPFTGPLGWGLHRAVCVVVQVMVGVHVVLQARLVQLLLPP